MRVVVIGATGHIGSYLIPTLVDAGFEVVGISRGKQMPYFMEMKEWREIESKKGKDIIPIDFSNENWKKAQLNNWKRVQLEFADRQLLEKEGLFGKFVRELKPDIVCDLTCYNVQQLEHLSEHIANYVHYYITMGSLWIYDYNITSPVNESHPRNGKSEYGLGKIAMETKIMELSSAGILPSTILHAGHIVGCGWIPLNPQGNFNKKVFEDIAAGRPLLLPDNGLATLHHVHVQDICDLIICCINNPQESISQSFHATSKSAITLRGYAESMYKKYNKDSNLQYLPLNDLIKILLPKDAIQTAEHVGRSPSASMEKAHQSLGFVPAYTSIQAVSESIDFLQKLGALNIK